MVFCNFLEIKAETKKVVGIQVVPFGVLYSCVKFRRLKMGDSVHGALMLLIFFSESVGGFWSYPHFSLFWNFEKFQFFRIISRTLLKYFIVPGDKKVSTHDKKTVDEVFFWLPVFNHGGARKNLSFSIIWIIWWPRLVTVTHYKWYNSIVSFFLKKVFKILEKCYFWLFKISF